MKFTSLSLKLWLYTALTNNNFFELTAVQEKTFKLVNQGRNVVISAPTGSGKTLCYLLPILNNLSEQEQHIQYVIIAPTKELVWQIYNNFLTFTKYNKAIKIVLLDKNEKVDNLVNKPSQIVIATVEKVRQAIAKGVNFKHLKQIVLDEADMLIDYGFVNSINDIFTKLDLYKEDVQKVFCSASIHSNVANTFKSAVANLVSIQLEKNIFSNDKIKHCIVYQKDNHDSFKTLEQLLNVINPYMCIIFANTKQDVEKIYSLLLAKGLEVGMLHKDLETRERKQVFSKLNHNEFKYLVATDLASRGLDIDGVSDVISFGLPKEDIWYLHRAGRTGRGKYTGNSYVIYDQKYDYQIGRLERKIPWAYYLLSNNQLIEKKMHIHKPKPIVDYEMKKEISKLYNKKNQKVKPGYKKKLKQQIYKMKQKAKHKYLEEKFNKIRRESYKKRKDH